MEVMRPGGLFESVSSSHDLAVVAMCEEKSVLGGGCWSQFCIGVLKTAPVSCVECGSSSCALCLRCF